MQTEPVFSAPDSEAAAKVLTKAARRVCEILLLDAASAAQLLGPDIVDHGSAILQPGIYWNNAVALIRLHEALVALLGNDQQAFNAWIYSSNCDLGCRPIDLLLNGELGQLLEYVQMHAP